MRVAVFSWLAPSGGGWENGQANVRMSTKCPCTAAVAAMAGLTGGVRCQHPGDLRSCGCWVEAQCSPGSRRSAFMARHMEQPGSRHSKPAALKIGAGLRARPVP